MLSLFIQKMTSADDEPSNPQWPINVFVFRPSDDVNDIKRKIEPTQDRQTAYERDGQKLITYNEDNHFSTKHYALLFATGKYVNCDFEVGYYVQMAGLGRSPKDVKFVTNITDNHPEQKSGPFVEALCKNENKGRCLNTFWRSAENFKAENCQWAVSQAAPLRNVHITKNLIFGDGRAYSSGGFFANAIVEGTVDYAANQQWLTRAVDIRDKAVGGPWNICFLGCTGNVPPKGRNGILPDQVVTIEEVPDVRVEKPFISMMKTVDSGEEYYELIVPSSTKDRVTGPIIDGQYGDVRSFKKVRVCKPKLPTTKNADGSEYYDEFDDDSYNTITAEDEMITNQIQGALDAKKDVVLCPGIFFLTKPLIVKHPNQVILGLGLATLVAPQDGSPCIRIEPHLAGVRITGLVLEASLQKPSSPSTGMQNADGVRSLLEVGVPGVKDAGDPHNPVLLADIFTRVGGSNLIHQGVETDVMVRIHSGNVVGENLWLWRADHVRLREGEAPNMDELPYHQTRIWESTDNGQLVKIGECLVKNAIVVNGDDVKIYGLFCEHTTEHQCIWNGERGTVFFFQCELPYDVNTDFADNGFVGYYVNPGVRTHKGCGIGVYSNFQVYDVRVDAGIKIPDSRSVKIENPFTVKLDNQGGINTVIKIGDRAYYAADGASGNGKPHRYSPVHVAAGDNSV